MSIRIQDIVVYPVKSCGGMRIERSMTCPTGLEFDRQWMIVDESSGLCLTQREIPQMALIGASVVDGVLNLKVPEIGPLQVDTGANKGDEKSVEVWGHRGGAIDCGDEAATLITEFLRPDQPCRLVRWSSDQPRMTLDRKSEISFVDAYPLHIVSQASLDDLNARLKDPIGMERFRPNIVVDGCGAYEEDGWETVRIGGVEFQGTYACIRCSITGVDQDTAERGTEPLATLAQYRQMGTKVIFGKYFCHSGEGEIALGAELEIKEGESSE